MVHQSRKTKKKGRRDYAFVYIGDVFATFAVNAGKLTVRRLKMADQPTKRTA